MWAAHVGTRGGRVSTAARLGSRSGRGVGRRRRWHTAGSQTITADHRSAIVQQRTAASSPIATDQGPLPVRLRVCMSEEKEEAGVWPVWHILGHSASVCVSGFAVAAESDGKYQILPPHLINPGCPLAWPLCRVIFRSLTMQLPSLPGPQPCRPSLPSGLVLHDDVTHATGGMEGNVPWLLFILPARDKMRKTVIAVNILQPDVLPETSDDAEEEHERRKALRLLLFLGRINWKRDLKICVCDICFELTAKILWAKGYFFPLFFFFKQDEGKTSEWKQFG